MRGNSAGPVRSATRPRVTGFNLRSENRSAPTSGDDHGKQIVCSLERLVCETWRLCLLCLVELSGVRTSWPLGHASRGGREFFDRAAAQRSEGARQCSLARNTYHADVHAAGIWTYVLVH